MQQFRCQGQSIRVFAYYFFAANSRGCAVFGELRKKFLHTSALLDGTCVRKIDQFVFEADVCDRPLWVDSVEKLRVLLNARCGLRSKPSTQIEGIEMMGRQDVAQAPLFYLVDDVIAAGERHQAE